MLRRTVRTMTIEQAIEHAEDTAISAIGCECREEHRQLAEWLRELQERRKAPEIVFCKDCARHNKSYGDNGAIDSCPLVLYRGKAQGHEFDYQYCAFAERRTDD